MGHRINAWDTPSGCHFIECILVHYGLSITENPLAGVGGLTIHVHHFLQVQQSHTALTSTGLGTVRECHD